MNILICSIPVEAPGAKLRRKRSEGSKPIMPKIACTALNNWAENNGYKCKFYDIDMLYPTDSELEEYFKNNPMDIIGLSAVTSTTYLQVKRISKIIKKIKSDTLIVCGGYLTAAANVILRKTNVDVCVVGNGEIAWVGLLDYVNNRRKNNQSGFNPKELLKIQGIAIVNESNNLEFSGYGRTLKGCHLNFPDFEWLKSGLNGDKEALANYFRPFHRSEEFTMDPRSFEKWRKPMYVNIFTSKGCVAKCTFCQRGSKGYDVYDLDKLDRYLTVLSEKYDVGFVEIADENFGSNKKYTYQVVELLNKHKMLWTCIGVRCTSVTKEDLQFYKDNGCSSLKFGLESGSQTMLDVMEKKFTVEDIKEAVFACADIGLHTPLLGWMIAMPGESEKTITESGQLSGELFARLRVPPNYIWGHNDIPYAIPLVGTPLYEYGKQLGLVGRNVDEEEDYLMKTTNVAILKRFYINFNGAPITEILFWDMLYWMETTRSYVKHMKGQPDSAEKIERYKYQIDLQNQNPHHKSKQKTLQIMGSGGDAVISWDHYFITNFLRKHIVFNKKIFFIPRFILNPIVKYSLYFEWLIQKYIFKDHHNLHKHSPSFLSAKFRINKENLDPSKTTQKERSLRYFVDKLKKDEVFSDQQKLESELTAGP